MYTVLSASTLPFIHKHAHAAPCLSSAPELLLSGLPSALSVIIPWNTREHSIQGHTQSALRAGDAAIFSLPSGKRLKQSPDAHMVFVTAVALSKGEDSLLSASADASAWLTGMPAGRGAKLSSTTTIMLLLLVLLLCAVAAAVWTGVDAHILSALERLGVKPAAHTEL